jgi:hypothetical protein
VMVPLDVLVVPSSLLQPQQRLNISAFSSLEEERAFFRTRIAAPFRRSRSGWEALGATIAGTMEIPTEALWFGSEP